MEVAFLNISFNVDMNTLNKIIFIIILCTWTFYLNVYCALSLQMMPLETRRGHKFLETEV